MLIRQDNGTASDPVEYMHGTIFLDLHSSDKISK